MEELNTHKEAEDNIIGTDLTASLADNVKHREIRNSTAEFLIFQIEG